MRAVVLIGTDHKFQKPLDGPHREAIENFRNTICRLHKQHGIRAVAEEMSLEVLNRDNLHESVARRLSVELGGLPHNYSDPNMEERRVLGILGNIDEDLSDRIREREWLRRITQPEFDTWPLLFICGATHFTPFANLLRDSGIHVIETYQDWGPIVEIVSPAPLYSADSYPSYARLGRHILSKVPRRLESNLLPDEEITVIESDCGKDFWALKVRVHGGAEGWVLDVDNGISISYPTI